MVATTELTNLAIDLIDVHKTYDRKIKALRGVNIQVGRGEIFGLLGPNGAGKSSLVKIMMTVIRADRVDGTILGRPIGHRGKLARIGYLPEDHRFPPYLTGRRLLDYYAALAKVPRDKRKQRAPELLDKVGLDRWGDTRIRKYSKGMLQRLGIAQALMNDPDLLVLDEPTDGVDPMGRRDIRELLQQLRGEGKTVFLNSHLLSELEMVCHRVSILVDGLVARQGTLAELTEHTIEHIIGFAGPPGDWRHEAERLGARIEQGQLLIPGHELDRLNQMIDLLRSHGVSIQSVTPHRRTLEDVLVEVVGQTRPAFDAGAASYNTKRRTDAT